MLDARNEPIDDLRRMFEIGVEQRDRQRAFVGVAEQIGIADFASDDVRHFLHGAFVRGDEHTVPFAGGLEDDEREEILGTDRAPQLAVEHELERAGRQQLRAGFIERRGVHRQEALSRRFSLIL